MRWLSAVAAVLAVTLAGLAPADRAEALDLDRVRAPAGYGTVRPVEHFVYHPRYQHTYHVAHVTDPYAYKYQPRGYYPYYGTRYWKPAHALRSRPTVEIPRYYKAWGYPRDWQNRAWHYKHHGRHYPWHW